MAKVKQPLEENGIHRAKMWEIMMYALNNTSTNTYMMVVGYISYFLIGIVGLASVLAGSIVTIMRIWDGVTDPFVGMMVDKTNGKFGKNRPFIVIGQIIMFVTTFVMFNFIPKMGTGVRFVAFIIIYMIYILGYTCQCVVTKSAQTCLTNDPKQRPIFAMCDTVYNIILMNIVIPVIVTDSLVPKFTLTAENNAAEIASLVAQNPALAGIVEKSGGSLSAFYNPGLFTTMQLMFGGLSAVFAVCAIIALWRKDNPKYFGLGTAQKVGIKDYVDTLAHNRAIQMLVVSVHVHQEQRYRYDLPVRHHLRQLCRILQLLSDHLYPHRSDLHPADEQDRTSDGPEGIHDDRYLWRHHRFYHHHPVPGLCEPQGRCFQVCNPRIPYHPS